LIGEVLRIDRDVEVALGELDARHLRHVGFADSCRHDQAPAGEDVPVAVRKPEQVRLRLLHPLDAGVATHVELVEVGVVAKVAHEVVGGREVAAAVLLEQQLAVPLAEQ